MAEWDIPNWFALVIELSIGIPLAVFLSIFFYRKQQKISVELEKIVKEQEEFRKRRLSYAGHSLRSYLPMLRYKLDTIVKMASQREEASPDSTEYKILEDLIDEELSEKSYFINRTEEIINQSTDVIDPAILNETREILEKAKYEAHKNEKGEWGWTDYKEIVHAIDELLKKLPNPLL